MVAMATPFLSNHMRFFNDISPPEAENWNKAFEAYGNLVFLGMQQLKRSYLLSKIEEVLPHLKVTNASPSAGNTSRTSSEQRAFPLVRLPASKSGNGASNIWQWSLPQLELRIQRKMVCVKPNQKLLQCFHESIAQQLHHIETIKIPSVQKESKQWDPRRSIGIVFGDCARRIGSFPTSTAFLSQINSKLPIKKKRESLSAKQKEALGFKAYADLVVEDMRFLKLSYLHSQIESFFPPTDENFQKLKDDISLEIKSGTFGHDSSPFMRSLQYSDLLHDDYASMLFHMEDDIQNQFISGHPNQKLLHDFYVYITQQLHKIKQVTIPSLLDNAFQWDPQRDIALRYGAFASTLCADGTTKVDNAYITRIFWDFCNPGTRNQK